MKLKIRTNGLNSSNKKLFVCVFVTSLPVMCIQAQVMHSAQ